MTSYYNEHDPFAAAWLRELIKAGLIAPGIVDERSIEDVRPSELMGYTQCHFFAGIGGWSLALRLSGWGDDRPVWTGSCPCQPFSAAGKGDGFTDERHLWPAWDWLIGECNPGVVFGEQVESAINHGWLDLVQTDLEAKGYAVGAVGLPACSVGAPHIRARAWFVAESLRTASERRAGSILGAEAKIGSQDRPQHGYIVDGFEHGGENGAGDLADAESKRERANETRSDCGERQLLAGAESRGHRGDDGAVGELGNTEPARLQEQRGKRGTSPETESADARETAERTGSSTRGFWHPADWLPCRDGKARPVEPATKWLADGLSSDLGLVRLESYPGHPHEERLIYAPLIQKGKARVGRLRGYGNAIVGPLAAEFIKTYREVIGEDLHGV